jgi:hypothetical protein
LERVTLPESSCRPSSSATHFRSWSSLPATRPTRRERALECSQETCRITHKGLYLSPPPSNCIHVLALSRWTVVCSLRQNSLTMSQFKASDDWGALSPEQMHQRLSQLGLILCENDKIVICKHCKYALQPSGQTVSKHLWEKHSVPAKDRAGLNAFVGSLKLQDPNSVSSCPDGSPTHPHLIVQRGVTCLTNMFCLFVCLIQSGYSR